VRQDSGFNFERSEMAIKARMPDEVIAEIQKIGSLSGGGADVDDFNCEIVEGMKLAYKKTCLYEYVEALIDNKYLME